MCLSFLNILINFKGYGTSLEMVFANIIMSLNNKLIEIIELLAKYELTFGKSFC